VVVSQPTTKWTATAYTFAEIAPGSVWVGIPLPDLADVLPTIGADPGYVPHITLVYADFGEQTVDETALAQIVARIADCVQWEPALSGEIVGYGRFYGQEPDGDPIFAIPSIPRLEDVRSRIVNAFEGYDGVVTVNKVAGFVPHITLGYIPTGSAMPEIGIPETPVTASAVSVVYAGREATIAFGTADYWAGPVVVEASEIGPRIFEELRFAAIPEWSPCLPKACHLSAPHLWRSRYVRSGARSDHCELQRGHLPDACSGRYRPRSRVKRDGWIPARAAGQRRRINGCPAEYTDIGKRLIEADRVKYVSPTVSVELDRLQH
jgi:hypothetical protein